MSSNHKLKDIKAIIKSHVNKWDPCSFIELGAPENEYDALINKIFSGVINSQDSSILKSEIIEMLSNYYGAPVFDDLNNHAKAQLSKEIDELIRMVKTN